MRLPSKVEQLCFVAAIGSHCFLVPVEIHFRPRRHWILWLGEPGGSALARWVEGRFLVEMIG